MDQQLKEMKTRLKEMKTRLKEMKTRLENGECSLTEYVSAIGHFTGLYSLMMLITVTACI